MGQKRVCDSKTQALQSKKRKKAAKADSANDNSWDGIVEIDDLNWKDVALPDRLEDAGGFLGLEEIDGVDIIRPQGSSEVRFKVRIRTMEFSNATADIYAFTNRQKSVNQRSPF